MVINPAYPRYALHEKMRINHAILNPIVLYLMYGVILGLGIGSAYGASTSVATKWFSDKKGLAGGLTAVGFGLGPLIIGPVAKSLIASMGIYSTFKVLGIVLLLVI